MPRLRSLDLFRGLTIAGMIVVNTAGGFPAIYPWLRHAEWNGWTTADLGLPFFLFIVGTATHFATGARRARGESHGQIIRHAIVRGAILFALGLVGSAFSDYDFGTMPLSGVLQRIAVTYIGATVLELYVGPRVEAVVVVVILSAYWLFFPSHLIPESRTPARIADSMNLFTMLPSFATVLIGVLAGRWMRARASCRERTGGLAAVGAIAMILGLVWSRWYPINMQLWTSSYALFTAGAGVFVLGGISWVVDPPGHQAWARLPLALGRNPLAMYVGSTTVDELLGRYGSIAIAGRQVPPRFGGYLELQRLGFSPSTAGLVYAVLFLLLWVAVARSLDRRGIVIKL